MSLINKKNKTTTQENKEPQVIDHVDIKGSDYDRKPNETQAEYNERVPVAYQPVLPAVDKTYLGEDR